ncbi:hypothetical protein HanIR_Chr09g0446791 [Helianthus annuus]|nr:hypothetical protein HanIR_Chr09g0446791 [Helianthus annuus]
MHVDSKTQCTVKVNTYGIPLLKEIFKYKIHLFNLKDEWKTTIILINAAK